MGKQWKPWQILFWGAPKITDDDCSHEIKTLAPWKKNYDQPRQHIKKQRHDFADKGSSGQSYGFSNSHSMDVKAERKRTDAFELWYWRTLESPLDCKEIQPVNLKGNQSWIFIGRTGAEAAIPILWPSDAKGQLIGKDPDAGKDWRQEEKGTTEDEMVGWITDWMDMTLSNLWELVMGREAWHAAVHEVAKSQTWLSDWTEFLFPTFFLPVKVLFVQLLRPPFYLPYGMLASSWMVA